MGHRGSAHNLRSGASAICRSLYVVFARRTGCIARADQRLSYLRETWCNHVTRRQRCGATASEDQWILGLDSPADDPPGSARLDFLFTRSAALGKSQTHAGSAAGSVVGCEQDWNVAAAD